MFGNYISSMASLRAALLCLGLAASVLSACSDDSTDGTNLCADVTCEGGVCNKANGLCENATDCAGDDALCLPGFSCSGDVCEADVSCESGSCERGVCANGACINPEGCSTNANCLNGFYCNAGVCEADPCADTTCERGICQIGTGECVNASVCTTATEASDCLEGSRCAGGVCVTGADFCANLECARGECSFEALACANAENCAGDDGNCLAGNYCAGDNTCKPNVCDTLSRTCARGECDPDSGDCVNPVTCSSASDCIDDNVCIAGACVPSDAACGADGCPGNQVCDYRDANSAAVCLENSTGCTTALDCTGVRVCDGGTCTAPAACAADAFEVNNTAGNETDFATANNGLPVAMTICDSDIDRIAFDTSADPDKTGTLVAEVKIAAADLGLGVLTLDLLDANGASVGTARTEANGAPTTTARIEYTITNSNGGVYTLVVADSGDVSTAGVRYQARLDVVDSAVIAACTSQPPLMVGTPYVGTTRGGSTAVASSCGDADGTYPEAVHTFTIDRAVYATFAVSAVTTTADFALSIRAVCEQADSELGCVESQAAGRSEILNVALAAGTYAVVVEATGANLGGDYALTVSTQDVVCGASTSTCADSNNASVCNATGTALSTVACDIGCDATTGGCSRYLGDTCANPVVVDTATGYTGLVEWDLLLNDYDPKDPSCVPGNTSTYYSTNGADAAYQVTVAPGDVLIATIDQRGSNFIAGYIVEDCADVVNSCLVGSNAASTADETLVWRNDTTAPKTVFLIADTKIRASNTSATIAIETQPAVCVPGTSRCVVNRESQTCNATGTGYDITTPCDNGCDAPTGLCVVTNDSCGGATRLPSGSTVAGTIVNYTSAHTTPEDGYCAAFGSDSFDANAEAVFQFTTTAPHQLVEIVVDNVSGFDPIVWVADSCTNNQIGTCVASVDASETDNVSETIKKVFPTPGTYFVVVEDGDSTVSVGSFDITATITDTTCVPGDPSALACDTTLTAIEYCGEFGSLESYLCQGVCIPGDTPSCGTPTGDSCVDAILLNGTQTSGTQSGNYQGSSAVALPLGTNGSCDAVSLTNGGDTTFAFDLQPGDLLTAQVRGGLTTSSAYLMRGNCLPESCEVFQKTATTTSTNTFQYLASAPERVYLVLDNTVTTTSATTWALNWQVEATTYQCIPGNVTCIDATTQLRCLADGLTEVTYTCPTGTCSPNGCVLEPAQGDTCDTAPDIGTGGTFIVAGGSGFKSDHSMASSNACYTGTSSGSGYDAFVRVTLQPFEVLEVTGTSSSTTPYPVLFAFKDCADITDSCVDGAAGVNNKSFRYQAGNAVEDLYVALDASTSTSTNDMTYTVNILAPECQPGGAPTCSADSVGLEICNDGLIQTYTCGGGCVNDACVVPRGDRCFDTIPLVGTSGTVSGDWVGNTNAVNIARPVANLCTFDSIEYPDSFDDIYRITLGAGETLRAKLDLSANSTKPAGARLYFVGDCYNPADTCLAVDPIAQTESEIAYRSELGETVYVVVDRDDTSATAFTYDLVWAIETALPCAPNTTRCLDATTVEYCDEDGVPTNFTCAAGCSGLACVADQSGETCETAVDLGTGAAIVGSWKDTASDVNFGGLCTGEVEDGRDLFYSINLTTGQRLEVTLLSLGDETPLLYLLSACATDASVCLAGGHEDAIGQVDNRVALTYNAKGDETIIIGVDNESPTADEPFFLLAEITTSDCDPDTFVQSCDATGTSFTYCDDGFKTQHTCEGVGTCNATTGRCDEPVGDVCVDPFVATPASIGVAEVFTGSFAGFANDYDLGTGNVCTQSRTVGNDGVYVVDMLANQVLTATLVSTAATPEDVALYLTQSCTDVRNQCLAGADVEGGTNVPEQLVYTASEDGPVYLMVDSFYDTTAGDYSLTVTVQ